MPVHLITQGLPCNNALVPSNWSHVDQIGKISKVCTHHGTCLRFTGLLLSMISGTAFKWESLQHGEMWKRAGATYTHLCAQRGTVRRKLNTHQEVAPRRNDLFVRIEVNPIKKLGNQTWENFQKQTETQDGKHEEAAQRVNAGAFNS